MKNIYLIILLGMLLVLPTSCLRDLLCVKGDGNIETVIRTPEMFHQLENSTSFDVIYKKADTTGIMIRTDQNLIDYIVTDTYNNSLEIKIRPGNICLDYSERPVIIVTSPGLNKAINAGSGSFFADEMSGETVTIKMSGSGDISVDHLTSSHDLTVLLSGSGNINLDQTVCLDSDVFLSGSGSITIKGECDNSYIKIMGSGNIYAGNYITNSGSVIISGSGNAFTYIENYLNAVISGSGNIYVRGDPVIDETISGSGRIIKYK